MILTKKLFYTLNQACLLILFISGCKSNLNDKTNHEPKSRLGETSSNNSAEQTSRNLHQLASSLWQGRTHHCQIPLVDLTTLKQRSPSITDLQNSKKLNRGERRKLAQEFESSGRLQEAIWLYAEAGKPEDRSKSVDLEHRLKQILESGPFTVSDKQLGGSYPKKLLLFEEGISGVFKKATYDEFANPKAEVAAYWIDHELLETHLVPMTVERTIEGVPGTVQVFIKNASDEIPESIFANNFPELTLFDHIMGNQDRKLGNILFIPDLNRVVAIDNGAGLNFIPCHDSADILRFAYNLPRVLKAVTRVNPKRLQLLFRSLFSTHQIQHLEISFTDLQKTIHSEACQLRIHPARLNADRLARLELFGEGAFCRLVSPRLSSVILPISDSESRAIPSHFSPTSSNHIFRDISPRDLPNGNTYNYVITSRVEIIYGKRFDSFQRRTTHEDLAKNKIALAAGELKIDEHGQYLYNLESSAVTQPILKLHPEYHEKIMSSAQKVFEREFGYAGTYAATPLDVSHSSTTE